MYIVTTLTYLLSKFSLVKVIWSGRKRTRELTIHAQELDDLQVHK